MTIIDIDLDDIGPAKGYSCGIGECGVDKGRRERKEKLRNQ
jgi:hypothetical protein